MRLIFPSSSVRRPERTLRYLGVPLGRAIYAAALDFWEGIAADPPGAAASTKASTDHQRS
jgi:hypothetical protein